MTVADNNGMGRDHSDIRPALRSIRSGSHVIVYRLTGYGAAVIRVLHEAMDYDVICNLTVRCAIKRQYRVT